MRSPDARDEKLDALLHLLSLQRADGGVKIDREAARTLELDYYEIKQMAEEIEVDAEVDKFLLLSTALVLIAVPLRFAEEAATWRPTLRKSKEWLDQVIDEARPRFRGGPLIERVEEFVRR